MSYALSTQRRLNTINKQMKKYNNEKIQKWKLSAMILSIFIDQPTHIKAIKLR